ncbi:hypothetical protein [Saccharicrinis aurantiacus]|uniref:hypothetical protein n=1 Tax=Saccharicrinis aurantiacus TaxID=1849719 RepID=UPI00094FD72B|nr:hypothetical protein [Saccharicrinis aurantiacus]
MKTLENGLPIIINESESFSIMGIIKGSVDIKVYDDGTSKFPVLATIDSNKGSGSQSLTIDGNKKESTTVSGVKITITISEWNCTDSLLSFHLKVEAKKSFIHKTVFNKTLSGTRHNTTLHNKKMELMNEEFEMTADQQPA